MAAAYIEQVKSTLEEALPDITKAPQGEMNLYSESKNVRVMITTAKKVSKSAYDNFQQLSLDLKPSLALFISCNDEIPWDVQTTPCLSYYLHISKLNEDIINHLKRLPEIKITKPKTTRKATKATTKTNDEDIDEEPAPKKTVKKTTKTNETEDEVINTKPKTFIDGYGNSVDEFDRYCSEVVKSKIEYKKACAKWPREMKEFTTLKSFQEYIVSLKGEEPKQVKVKTNSTLEDFTQYLLTTPASKLRMGFIKEQFGHLEESKMTLASIKEWQKELKENE